MNSVLIMTRRNGRKRKKWTVIKKAIPVARDLISHGGSPAEMRERERDRERGEGKRG